MKKRGRRKRRAKRQRHGERRDTEKEDFASAQGVPHTPAFLTPLLSHTPPHPAPDDVFVSAPVPGLTVPSELCGLSWASLLKTYIAWLSTN